MTRTPLWAKSLLLSSVGLSVGVVLEWARAFYEVGAMLALRATLALFSGSN